MNSLHRQILEIEQLCCHFHLKPIHRSVRQRLNGWSCIKYSMYLIKNIPTSSLHETLIIKIKIAIKKNDYIKT